jgi:hypothetical protein
MIRMFAKGSPGTMNKEYQEATNEYLKVCFPLLPWLLCYLVFGWRERGMDREWEGRGKGERVKKRG